MHAQRIGPGPDGFDLFKLSPPLRGNRICSNGKIARKPVTHVLVGRGIVLESNPDGAICGWGAWPKSRGKKDTAATLGRIGYSHED